jgi:hypothetical protein
LSRRRSLHLDPAAQPLHDSLHHPQPDPSPLLTFGGKERLVDRFQVLAGIPQPLSSTMTTTSWGFLLSTVSSMHPLRPVASIALLIRLLNTLPQLAGMNGDFALGYVIALYLNSSGQQLRMKHRARVIQD